VMPKTRLLWTQPLEHLVILKNNCIYQGSFFVRVLDPLRGEHNRQGKANRVCPHTEGGHLGHLRVVHCGELLLLLSSRIEMALLHPRTVLASLHATDG
jgi:hypothetical protein